MLIKRKFSFNLNLFYIRLKTRKQVTLVTQINAKEERSNKNKFIK